MSPDPHFVYDYSPTGNLISKSNYTGSLTPTQVDFDHYEGNKATWGVYNGDSLLGNLYDGNGNRTRKIVWNTDGFFAYADRYTYNIENKMVMAESMPDAYGNSNPWPKSYQFYHLDGSRMWEGFFPDDNSDIEGQFSMNSLYNLRLQKNNDSFYTFYVFANGRRIASFEKEITDLESFGCSLSPLDRLRFASFTSLLVNAHLLILPAFVIILIRGWFFDKSWRKKRVRKTIAFLLVFGVLLGVTPMPASSQEMPDDVHLWFGKHLKQRLAKMYGDEDRIPRSFQRPAQKPVPFGNAASFREAALYFLPNGLERQVEGAYIRTARLFFGGGSLDGGSLDGGGDTLVAETSGKRETGVSPPPDGKTTGAEPSSSRVAHTVFSENRVGGAGRSTGMADQGPDTTTASSLLDQAGSFLAAAYNELLAPQTAYAWSGAALLADGIRFYHTDHLGSVRVITKSDASIQEVIDYDPFGSIIMDTKSGFEQDRNKYTGQMFDYMTGLYYYGARYYDPETGRFTQADTIVPNPLEAQDFNRYSYCGNNPMKYVDPSGHWYFTGSPVGWACAFIGAVIGAVIGGIAGSFMGNWQGGMAYGFEYGWNFGMQFGTMWQFAPDEPPPEAPGVFDQMSEASKQEIIAGAAEKFSSSAKVNMSDSLPPDPSAFTQMRPMENIEMPQGSNALYIYMINKDPQVNFTNYWTALRNHALHDTDFIFAITEYDLAIQLNLKTQVYYTMVWQSHGASGIAFWEEQDGTKHVWGVTGKTTVKNLHPETMKALQSHLTQNPTVIFYGCSIAADPYGKQAMKFFSQNLNNATVYAALGPVESYHGGLGPFDANTFAGLTNIPGNRWVIYQPSKDRPY